MALWHCRSGLTASSYRSVKGLQSLLTNNTPASDLSEPQLSMLSGRTEDIEILVEALQYIIMPALMNHLMSLHHV